MASTTNYQPTTTPAAKKIADGANYLTKTNNGVSYNNATDYQAKIDQAVAAKDYASAAQYEQQRNAKIQGQGLNYETTNNYANYLTKTNNGVSYNNATDYQAKIDQAVAAKDYASAAQYEQQRNAKIQGEGLNYATTSQYQQYLNNATNTATTNATNATDNNAAKSYNGVNYDLTTDYMQKMKDAVANGDYVSAAQYEQARNAKIQGEGLNYDTTNVYSKYVPKSASESGVADAASILSQMTELLNQWKEASSQQQTNQIDYQTQQSITELERTLEDAQSEYQTQRNQVATDERKALDNAALYAEARGDRGGIGMEQYNLIQSSAAQNRLAVSQAQTKLSTDTARQIADLRAQGEFEKADAVLSLAQTYLSQLMSLQQWSSEYAMDYAQFEESLREWQVEFDLNMAELTGTMPGGGQTLSAQQTQTEQLASIGSALLSAGVMPNDEQLSAMGMTKAQAQNYITAQNLASSSNNSGSGGGSSTSTSKTGTSETATVDTGTGTDTGTTNQTTTKSNTELYNETVATLKSKGRSDILPLTYDVWARTKSRDSSTDAAVKYSTSYSDYIDTILSYANTK